ncbi:MAG: amidophosphoribosyltransferase [bacterium]
MGGFFGIASKEDCVAELFYGTDYHSHLGTRRGGLVVRNSAGLRRSIHDLSNAQFRSKFEGDLAGLHGNLGLGVISDFEDQPLIIGSHHGVYSIVTVGRVFNLEELATEALRTHTAHFSEITSIGYNPTELIASLINQGDTIQEGVRSAQQAIDGSASMLLLTDQGVIAARDLWGRTPIALGKKDGAHAATMETCALHNLGFQIDRQLGPGEVVRITAEGVEQLVPPRDELQICTFLWIYYGYPASEYEGINVEASRNRCGAALARRDNVAADFAAGIPDSGIGHAIGYATESGVPYRRPFVKYTPTWPRSFMPQEQRVRDLVARMKLIPVEELIRGYRLLFCEDSIVRGTQLTDIIKRLFDIGAKELHMRPACPPLLYGCKYLNFSRSRSELDLAARRAVAKLEPKGDEYLDEYADAGTDRYARMIEQIRKQIGLTTLQYQRLDDMVEAIGMPRDKVCTFCWNGDEGCYSKRS